MNNRPLGASGLEVSEIGFGTWGLGGTVYGPTSDRESIDALHKAHELGVSFYDTSDFYGLGHSETLLGQAFADCRQSVFLATKAGLLGPDGSRQDFSPGHLEDALRQSLKRLRTDYVDLFQLHSPSLGKDEGGRMKDEKTNSDSSFLLPPSSFLWLHSLKARGLARLVGISVRSPDDGLAIVSDFAIDAIQVNFNLVDQRALNNGLLDLCARKGVGVIIRTPLCFGFLTGTLAGTETFPEGDHRNRWSLAQRQRWSEAVQIFWNGVRSTGQTPAQFALRFCLSQPGVSTVSKPMEPRPDRRRGCCHRSHQRSCKARFPGLAELP